MKASTDPVEVHESTDDDENSYAIATGDLTNVMAHGIWQFFDKGRARYTGTISGLSVTVSLQRDRGSWQWSRSNASI